MVGQHGQVLISNLVVLHIGRQEVDHGCSSGIHQNGHVLTAVAVASPGLGVGHLRCRHHIDRVKNTRGGLAAHGLAFLG